MTDPSPGGVVVLKLKTVGLWWWRIVMIPVAIPMIAVVGMMHGFVITLDEALTVILALVAFYGWMAKHARAVRIHTSLVFHVEARCLDAVMEALPCGVVEL